MLGLKLNHVSKRGPQVSKILNSSQIAEFTTITILSSGEDIPEGVFSSTAVHCFPASKLCEMPSDVWLNKSEPVYDDDVEIIQNKKIKFYCRVVVCVMIVTWEKCLYV